MPYKRLPAAYRTLAARGGLSRAQWLAANPQPAMPRNCRQSRHVQVCRQPLELKQDVKILTHICIAKKAKFDAFKVFVSKEHNQYCQREQIELRYAVPIMSDVARLVLKTVYRSVKCYTVNPQNWIYGVDFLTILDVVNRACNSVKRYRAIDPSISAEQSRQERVQMVGQ